MIKPNPVGEVLGIHKECGGDIQLHDFDEEYILINLRSWRCTNCSTVWSREEHMLKELDPRCTLVWVEDKWSGMLHSALVPTHTAKHYKKVLK